ncbi:MAG TPA: GlsB/YeaQ/YmgE family stress response membrane protein [Roseiflexaceae bacterium]|nr:GlsB/YeaQ/YmgE family stress response membrane protein [Roseiflexaceae bacterium]
MSLLETLILLAIAGLIGALAEFLIGFSLGGMIGATIVGVVGGLIGDWLARSLHLPAILPIQVGTRTIELVWTTLGSILLVGLLSVLRTRRSVARR